MRFKIFYNDNTRAIEINCLNDSNTVEAVLPANSDDHVVYPIPNALIKKISKEMDILISEKDANEFKKIQNQIKVLTDKRKKLTTKMRQEMNPIIFDKCKTFKKENAEYFL